MDTDCATLPQVSVLHRTGFSRTCPPSGPANSKTWCSCSSEPHRAPQLFLDEGQQLCLPSLLRSPRGSRAHIPGHGAQWHQKWPVLSCFGGISWLLLSLHPSRTHAPPGVPEALLLRGCPHPQQSPQGQARASSSSQSWGSDWEGWVFGGIHFLEAAYTDLSEHPISCRKEREEAKII